MRTFIALLLSVSLGNAATYFISTTGSDSAGGTFVAPFASMHKAATVMASGDALFIRGGFYNCTNIATPYFDPTANNLVVSNYPGETPIFAHMGIGIPELFAIYNRTNIKVFGITATNCGRTFVLNSSTNCELGWCNFSQAPTNFGYPLVTIVVGSQLNWVHDCIVYGCESDTAYNPQADKSNPFQIGQDPDNPLGDVSWYNLVERCQIYQGGHGAIGLEAGYNIIRSNIFHNEPWIWWNDYQQLGGHRVIDLEPSANNTVLENNWIAYAGQPLANDGSEGITASSPTNIIRGNLVMWAQNSGMRLYSKEGPAGPSANGSRVYNNTFAWNGLGQWYTTNLSTSCTNIEEKGTISTVRATNNVLINNILAYNTALTLGEVNLNHCTPDYSIHVLTTNGIFIADSTWGKNWTNNTSGDPKFVNIIATNKTLSGGVVVLGDPFDTTTLNLQLQPTSPCIDAGVFLTTVTSGSGTGTTLTIADPYFFYNGYGKTLGDQIQIQGHTERARIQSINYGTGGITVDSPLTWTTGQGVALAYNGTGPDMGAFETGFSYPVPPLITTQPISQTVLVGTPVTFSVVASGTLPLSYQWNFNSAAISGATATSYTISSPTTADSGQYMCTVTNIAGSRNSFAATLNVTNSTVNPNVKIHLHGKKP